MSKHAKKKSAKRQELANENALSSAESKDFERFDNIVRQFACDLVTAGDALCRIRDGRLYRGTFKAFEEYCQSVQEMSRQYANRLIRAGEIKRELEPIVSEFNLPEPANEAQLRELSRLDSSKARIEVYKGVCQEAGEEKKTVTAKLIGEAVDKHLDKEVKGKPKPPTPTERITKAKTVLRKFEKSFEDEDRETMAKLIEELKKLLQ